MTNQGYTVLVVDDNEMNRDMLSRRLSRQGYGTEMAADGKQALEILRANPRRFDVVLLDIMMPVLNGYEALEQIKADPKLKNIPVIMVSAMDEMDSVIKCIELGAEDYLNKPVNAVLLEARLRPTLERKRIRDQERQYIEQIEREKRRADELLNVVIPMGIGLSAERDFSQLLELVVIQAMNLAYADGGTLYLRQGEELRFQIVRNDSLKIAMGGISGNPITFAPLPLHLENGQPNEANVAAYAAVHGQGVNVPDAYEAEHFDFSGTRAFDQKTGYRTKSVLAIPLKNLTGEVTGVLQLINAHDPDTGEVIGFETYIRELSESLALLAAAALDASMRETQLRKEIEELRIVINEQRKEQNVSEIVESEFFQDLQNKAHDFRRKRSPNDPEG